MTNWLTVFRFEFRQQFKRTAYLFTTFGIPAIALVLLGLGIFLANNVFTGGADGDEQPIETEFEGRDPVGYVDQTGVFPAPDEDSPFHSLVIRYESVSDGKSALDRGDIGSLFILADDFVETGSAVEWLESFSVQNLDNDVMEAYVLYTFAQGVDDDVIRRLRDPLAEMDTHRISRDGGAVEETDEGIDFAQVYAFAFLLMFGLYGSSGYLMNSVVSEKESKSIEIVLVSVRPLALMTGKVVAMGTLGLITVGVWVVAISVLAWQAAENIGGLGTIAVEPQTAVIAFVYYFVGFLFMGSIFAGIGAITNTLREGSTIAGWLVFPVVIPLMFTASFVEDPNGTLPQILSLIPPTAPLAMVMRSSLTSVPLGEVLLSVGLLAVLAVGALWVASRLFRVNTLLSGSRPKLRELPRLLLGG